MKETSLAKTLSRLYNLKASDIKFGLETENAILSHLDNPEKSLQFIHVAGTNGKGSVCAMLDSVLREAGLKTGLYTSPHLVHFNERMRVNGICVSDSELAELICRVEEAARKAALEPKGRDATFFELATAMAFEHFKRKQVQIAVMETGMGGRLDATNVITPLVSVITSISLEHTTWLGPDIKSIAREKCGIIKQNTPIITGDLPPEAMEIVRATARERKAPLIEAKRSLSVQCLKHDAAGVKMRLESSSVSYGTFTIPMPGIKTPENAAVATAVIEALGNFASLDLQPECVKNGLSRACWPGRFQLISKKPPVIVDGAHNPEAANFLAKSLRIIYPDTPVGLIVGMASDKDIHGFLTAFAGLTKHCWVVPIKNERSRATSDIAAQVRALGWDVVEGDLDYALQEAKKWALKQNGVACITGSLFLAGEMIENARIISSQDFSKKN